MGEREDYNSANYTNDIFHLYSLLTSTELSMSESWQGEERPLVKVFWGIVQKSVFPCRIY